MNLILIDSDQVRGYTDLNDVFEPFREEVSKYNWLITDFEAYPSELFNASRLWLSGEKLLNLVENNNIQFIWGVVSAFQKNIEIDVENLSFMPIADGNKQLWSNNPRIQHENACVEIICWDSTATILMSKDIAIANKYKCFYSDAQNLNEYNKRINRQYDFVKDVLIKYIDNNRESMKYRRYVSSGHEYDINRYIGIIISNLRYKLYGRNYEITPKGKDVKKIIELFINTIT